MHKSIFAAVTLTVLAACTPPQAITTTSSRTIDDSFFGDEIRWRSGPRVPYRLGVFDEDGFFVVCAAVQNVRRGEDQQLVAAIKVTANDQILVSSLRWAPRYPGTGDINGRQADCRKTEVPFDPQARVSLGLTKTSFTRQGF